MSVTLPSPTKPIIYPDSDGNPIADNTLQFQYIVMLKEGLEALFASDPNVFVAGDLLWYPVEGNNRLRVAPDVFVAFGRPKGYRGSYKPWLEAGVAPQVVFEILSPGNRSGEMTNKALFYDRFGVEEYYIYDPDTPDFSAFLRSTLTGRLEPVPADEKGIWQSGRLGVRFELTDKELLIYRPDGERFKTLTQMMAERDAERNRAEAERNRAEAERNRAEEAELKAQRLAARLRELGIDPDNPAL